MAEESGNRSDQSESKGNILVSLIKKEVLQTDEVSGGSHMHQIEPHHDGWQ